MLCEYCFLCFLMTIYFLKRSQQNPIVLLVNKLLCAYCRLIGREQRVLQRHEAMWLPEIKHTIYHLAQHLKFCFIIKNNIIIFTN